MWSSHTGGLLQQLLRCLSYSRRQARRAMISADRHSGPGPFLTVSTNGGEWSARSLSLRLLDISGRQLP